MTVDHGRPFIRFFCNRSAVFDDASTHDAAIGAVNWLPPDAPDDQFTIALVDGSDALVGNDQTAVASDVAPDRRSLDDTLPAFDVPSGLIDDAQPALDGLIASAATADDDDFFSFFASDGHDSGPLGGGAPYSVTMPLSQSLDASILTFALSQTISAAQSFMLGAFDASVAVSAKFDAPDVGSASGSDMTPIDADFFAKGDSGTASATGGSGGGMLKQYFSGSADGTAGYDIWIEFKGTGWTAGLQDAFIKAADYLTTVITSDIGGGGLYRGKIVDDLYVSAELKAIDGTGGILGQAGPSAVWTTTELTAAGQMQFDVADAVNYRGLGLWDDIVTHEMMHVLGFGSLWNYGTNPLVSNNQYTGANALAAYNSYFGLNATFIPVENDGGSGTAGSHWDEQALTNELMTGYINNDGNAATVTDNYLSKFSVMSLADLGYAVTYRDYPYDGILIA